jgi:hypothetical protein
MPNSTKRLSRRFSVVGAGRGRSFAQNGAREQQGRNPRRSTLISQMARRARDSRIKGGRVSGRIPATQLTNWWSRLDAIPPTRQPRSSGAFFESRAFSRPALAIIFGNSRKCGLRFAISIPLAKNSEGHDVAEHRAACFISCLVLPNHAMFRLDTLAVARLKPPGNRMSGQQKAAALLAAVSGLRSDMDGHWVIALRGRHTADASLKRLPEDPTRVDAAEMAGRLQLAED